MINQTTGQYTFGVPQQNNVYYSCGYGTIGGSNPYEQGGSKYVGSMLPGNNGGAGGNVGGLLAQTNNIQRPGFDDASGKPINTFYSAQEAVDGGDKHRAYTMDHRDWRMGLGYWFGNGKKPGQSDFDYPGRTFTNSTGDKVRVGEATWDDAKELAGNFANAVMPGGFVRSLFNANTNIPNLITSSAANLFDYNYHPLSESFTKQNEPGFDVTDQSTFIKPTSNSLMDEPLEVAQQYVVHPVSGNVSEPAFPSFNPSDFSATYNTPTRGPAELIQDEPVYHTLKNRSPRR